MPPFSAGASTLVSQKFTANGNFTAEGAGDYLVIARGGGGGGGGGAGCPDANDFNPDGGPRGGDGELRSTLVSLTQGQTVAVVIGLGGAGGSGGVKTDGGAGTAGGSTTFNGSTVAFGGAAGNIGRDDHPGVVGVSAGFYGERGGNTGFNDGNGGSLGANGVAGGNAPANSGTGGGGGGGGGIRNAGVGTSGGAGGNGADGWLIVIGPLN